MAHSNEQEPPWDEPQKKESNMAPPITKTMGRWHRGHRSQKASFKTTKQKEKD